MNKKISKAPQHGFGLHDWILESTRMLLGQGQSKESVYAFIRSRTHDKGREVSDYEINTAIDGAINWYNEHPGAKPVNGQRKKLPLAQYIEERKARGGQRLGYRRPPSPQEWKAELDPRLEAKALQTHIPMLDDLSNFELWQIYSDLNYPVCLAREAKYPEIRPVKEWEKRKWQDYQFISPNPFLKCGVGVGTKVDANAGERLWMIVEFDRGTKEEQLRKLFWLDQIRALGFIVYSGGKSLHGWFPVVGVSERLCCQFFRLATAIGADKGMQSSIQYTRLPWGLNRKTGKRQPIIHLDDRVMDEATAMIKENAV